jgi:ribonucleoside-diphosphate reductase alpha chain
VRTAYECAEPGVIFIDRVRALDNLGYAERISATNPCGEIPLPPFGACDLGSLNLTRFVVAPFTPEACLDVAALQKTAQVAVRMLDNVYDVSGFPLPQQAARRAHRGGSGSASPDSPMRSSCWACATTAKRRAAWRPTRCAA